MTYTYTTQRALRAAFWREHANAPGVSRRRIRDYSGRGTMYNTDTRCAWVDWLDALSKNGEISPLLAFTAVL